VRYVGDWLSAGGFAVNACPVSIGLRMLLADVAAADIPDIRVAAGRSA